MFQTKFIKGFALVVALCSVVNAFSFGVTASDDVIYAFNFDEGQQQTDIFSDTMFTIENKKLRTIAAESSFTLPNVTKNSTLEFKLKSAVNEAIPKFNVNLGNTSITYVNDYRVNSAWDDKISMYNRVTWGAAVSTAWANGEGDIPADTFFPENGKEYMLRLDSYENKHDLYIDGVLVISGDCVGTLDSYNAEIVIYNAAKGVYIDDITVKELTKAPESPIPGWGDTGNTEGDQSGNQSDETEETGNTYIYTFDDGNLPKEFSSDYYNVEDGRLKIISGNGSFTLKDVPRNGSIEFRIEAAAGGVIPNLTLTLKTCDLSYTANYVQDKTWDDVFSLRNTENSWSQIAEAWASADTFFPEKDGGHIVKFIADGNTYSLYIDNVQKLSAECPTVSDNQSFDLRFLHSDKNGAIKNVGFYLDDIMVNGIYADKEFGIPSLPELLPDGETELYSQSFDKLTVPPAKGNGVDYKENVIEDGHLCASVGKGFIIPSTYSDHRLEMDIQSEGQKKINIRFDLKKNLSGYKYEVVYEDSDTETPGSKWTFIKKDSDGKETLAMVERSLDDISSTELRHLSIECYSNTLAVYIDGQLVADAPSSMLKGVDYSSWAYTEVYPYKVLSSAETFIINNIRLVGLPMDISDAVSCTEQVFMNDDKQVSLISELTPGKVKMSAKVSSIDMDMSRNITAIMVMFKNGYMTKAVAKTVSLPEMRLLPAKYTPVELEMEVSANDLAGENTQIEFYVWGDMNNMTSCGGLSTLN